MNHFGRHDLLTHPMLDFNGEHGPLLVPAGTLPTAIETREGGGSLIYIMGPGILLKLKVLESTAEVNRMVREGLESFGPPILQEADPLDFPGDE